MVGYVKMLIADPSAPVVQNPMLPAGIFMSAKKLFYFGENVTIAVIAVFFPIYVKFITLYYF